MDVLNQPADVSAVLTEVLALDGRAGDPWPAGCTPTGWRRPGTPRAG